MFTSPVITNISKLELENTEITSKIIATLFSGLALEGPPALICIRVAPRQKHRQEHEEPQRRKHRQEHEKRLLKAANASRMAR